MFSLLQSFEWLVGWTAKRSGRTVFFSLSEQCTTRAPRGGPSLSWGWCRPERLWARRTPRQQGPRPRRSRRPRTRARVRGVRSPQRLRSLPLHRHQQGHQNTPDLSSSSTPSWLMGVPQAVFMDSLMSRSCMPRSQKCSTSPPQRYNYTWLWMQ